MCSLKSCIPTKRNVMFFNLLLHYFYLFIASEILFLNSLNYKLANAAKISELVKNLGHVLQRVDINRNLFAIDINRNY